MVKNVTLNQIENVQEDFETRAGYVLVSYLVLAYKVIDNHVQNYWEIVTFL